MEPTGTKETRTATGGRQAAPADSAGTRRAAILAAAGEAFLSKGYAATTTLEIARLARTSKRSLYQHFADKRAILDEMVRERSGEMTAPIEMEPPQTSDEFFATIEAFGATFLTRLLDPSTIALYRLAIAESGPADDLGRALNANGRDRVTDRLRRYIGEGAARGFIDTSDLDTLTDVYLDLLTGWLLVRTLLDAESPPNERSLRDRVERAAKEFRLMARRV